MTILRSLEERDKSLLQESLAKDQYHKETPVEFFYSAGAATLVYEDDAGPVFVVRGTKALRMDIQFLDNNQFDRNRKMLEENFHDFAERARQQGFTELVFCSNSPLLIAFCKRKFGFAEVQGELRRYL